MKFVPGSLWNAVVKTSTHAFKTGALLSFPTESALIEEEGIGFFVRVLAALQKKDEERKKQNGERSKGKTFDPFLPPEKDLTVADISATHCAVLNKYNVMEHHLLIVTRAYEEQERLLTPADFEALWRCMAEYDALGFYNGGVEAGASQKHKHLQMVPLPIVPAQGPKVPIEPVLANLGETERRVPGFPFQHAFVRLAPGLWTDPGNASEKTYRDYCEMLVSLGMQAPDPEKLTWQSGPYCLVVTREWMLLVPRSREFFEEVSLNALAFAGSFFVRDRAQLEALRKAGPMNVLKQVAVPIPSSS